MSSSKAVILQTDNTANLAMLSVLRGAFASRGGEYQLLEFIPMLEQADFRDVRTLVVGRVSVPEVVGEALRRLDFHRKYPDVKVVWYHVQPPAVSIFSQHLPGLAPPDLKDLVRLIAEANMS